MPGVIMTAGRAWKRTLYLSFLLLLGVLKQRTVASLLHPPPLGWEVAADTEKQSHSLAYISWPGLWAGMPSCEDKCVCVCTLIRGGSIFTVGNQLQHILPATDGNQNGRSYFEPLIRKMVTHNIATFCSDLELANTMWANRSMQCSNGGIYLCLHVSWNFIELEISRGHNMSTRSPQLIAGLATCKFTMIHYKHTLWEITPATSHSEGSQQRKCTDKLKLVAFKITAKWKKKLLLPSQALHLISFS